ncbi:hypothetical protein LINGRAHAP2_LOCUS30254 [Linum grandiflorum]
MIQVPLIDYDFDFAVDDLTHFIHTLNEEEAAEQFQQVQSTVEPIQELHTPPLDLISFSPQVPLIDYDVDFIDRLYSPSHIPSPLSSDFVDSVDSFSYLQDDYFLI